MVRYAHNAENPEKTAKARGQHLRTHFKNTREVAAALTGLKLSKAYKYLGDVQEHRDVIPFRRFNGGVGRAAQAKNHGTTQGRWPVKSIGFLLRLLKNAEANADAKSLDTDDLLIKHIVVQQAPVSRALYTKNLKILTRHLENPSSYLPCSRSYQPLPR